MIVNQKRIGGKNKQDIFRYTLKNDFLTIIIFNYGGIIHKIIMPDKNNRRSNIVLSYPRVEDYYSNPAYLGAFIGRVAGRIPQGLMKIQGEKFFLSKNEKIGNSLKTTLHGGKKGFNQKVAQGKIFKKQDQVGVTLTFFSKDGEEGFPGDVSIISNYCLKAKNVFSISHSTAVTKSTFLNFTHHSYFNLSGKRKETIENHYLKIMADKILSIDDNHYLQPKIFNIKKTPFDFRENRKISFSSIKENALLEKFRGYDHYFLFSNDNSENKKEKIVLYHPSSGRKVKIHTNQKGMIFYTGNHLDTIKSKKSFTRYQGLCLEVQDYPYFLPEKIPPGFRFFQQPRLSGSNYFHETEYHFSIEK